MPSMFTSTRSDCATRRRDVTAARWNEAATPVCFKAAHCLLLCTNEGGLNAHPAVLTIHSLLCSCCAVVYYQLELTSSVQPGQALVTALCWHSMRANLSCIRCLQLPQPQLLIALASLISLATLLHQWQASSAVAALARTVAAATCTIARLLQHHWHKVCVLCLVCIELH
jgi:hypothetical protein